MATILSLFAVLMPNYVTFLLTILTQVLMIGIPSHLYQDNTRKRLDYYILASFLLLAIVVFCMLYKVYLTIASESIVDLQSWGVYADQNSANQLNVFLTFFYETLAIALLLAEFYITKTI
jgi:hypothetical protein